MTPLRIIVFSELPSSLEVLRIIMQEMRLAGALDAVHAKDPYGQTALHCASEALVIFKYYCTVHERDRLP